LILFFKLLENANIQIFSIGYPSTPFPSILSLSKFGQHYSVADDDNVLDPLKISGQLSRIFLDIISQVENQPHHQVFVKVSFSLLFVVIIFDWAIWASLWTEWKQYFYDMIIQSFVNLIFSFVPLRKQLQIQIRWTFATLFLYLYAGSYLVMIDCFNSVWINIP